MALKSVTQRSFFVNLLVNIFGEQDEVAGQSSVEESNVGSNEAFMLSLVFSLIKDLLTKFIKAFVELTQAWEQNF